MPNRSDEYDPEVTDSTNPQLAHTQLSTAGRRSELLHMARAQGKLELASIPALLGVSAETIRRDLALLESQGLIRRGYGVAHPVEGGSFESALAARRNINPEEKIRIAMAVIPQIGAAETLFIDEGFQTQLIAQRLPEDRPFTVVTASLPVATILAARSNIQVMLLGGRVRGITMGVVDAWAVESLQRLRIDLAILGANGVSVESGVTTPDPSVAVVKEAALKSSARHIFIGAHHKFGRVTFVKYADIEDFEVLITGRELQATIANRFTAAGAHLIRA